jgi:hypothetical protein
MGLRPYYAPKPLRGGATKGARGGRFWILDSQFLIRGGIAHAKDAKGFKM